jgi:hypothetical protein
MKLVVNFKAVNCEEVGKDVEEGFKDGFSSHEEHFIDKIQNTVDKLIFQVSTQNWDRNYYTTVDTRESGSLKYRVYSHPKFGIVSCDRLECVIDVV